MPSLSVTIPGIPATQRPRIAAGGRGLYKVQAVRDWMKLVQETAFIEMRKQGYEAAPKGVPVALMLDVFIDRPKNTRKDLREKEELHTVRPDTDNYLKPIKDALTDAGLWQDDSQVAQEYVEKKWCKLGMQESRSKLLGAM